MSLAQTVRVPVSKCSDDQPIMPAVIYNYLLDTSMMMVSLRERSCSIEFGTFSAVLTTDLMVRSTGTEEGVMVTVLTDQDGKMIEFNVFVTSLEAGNDHAKPAALLS